MDSFKEVAKSLIDAREALAPSLEQRESMKAAIDILNNTDGVEVARPFGPVRWRLLRTILRDVMVVDGGYCPPYY